MTNLIVSPTLRINEQVKSMWEDGKDVLHLGFGESRFPVHPEMRNALMNVMLNRSYLPSPGTKKLREKIAGYYSKKLGWANNIKRANQIIESWIDKHRSINSPLWSVDFVSSRYINIVYALDFLSILFDQKLKEKIYRFLYLHYWLLKNQLNYNNKKI